jgi:RNA polymerase sigma-70 factor (ECF subfamily)
MLGSVSEAEDVTQEALLRLTRQDEPIDEPAAWLTTVATRLSINVLRSARVRRESYVGPWLPEPLVEDPAPGPAARAELADTLSLALLALLERLTPVERAAYLLREVFGYDYAEIARVVDKSEANCRQLVSRARRHIDEGKPRFEASRQKRFELAEQFMAAAQRGDMDGLVSLLAGDVAFYGDGGGIATALPRPMFGREAVARFLLGVFRRGRLLDASVQMVEVNGQPGAVTTDAEGRVISVFSLDIVDGQVQTIRGVVNPEKLHHIGPTSPLILRDGGAAT